MPQSQSTRPRKTKNQQLREIDLRVRLVDRRTEIILDGIKLLGAGLSNVAIILTHTQEAVAHVEMLVEKLGGNTDPGLEATAREIVARARTLAATIATDARDLAAVIPTVGQPAAEAAKE